MHTTNVLNFIKNTVKTEEQINYLNLKKYRKWWYFFMKIILLHDSFSNRFPIWFNLHLLLWRMIFSWLKKWFYFVLIDFWNRQDVSLIFETDKMRQKSSLKQSAADLSSEFSFSQACCLYQSQRAHSVLSFTFNMRREQMDSCLS